MLASCLLLSDNCLEWRRDQCSLLSNQPSRYPAMYVTDPTPQSTSTFVVKSHESGRDRACKSCNAAKFCLFPSMTLVSTVSNSFSNLSSFGWRSLESLRISCERRAKRINEVMLVRCQLGFVIMDRRKRAIPNTCTSFPLEREHRVNLWQGWSR